MRDVNRIYPFCIEIAQLWSKHPDLRFGQIMSNVEKYAQIKYGKDIFYMEENELIEVIKEQLK